MHSLRVVLNLALFGLLLGAAPMHAETKALTDAQRLDIALEALSRIQSDIKTNAELKEAVYGLLPRVRGTAHLVQIVKRFQLADQDDALLEIAAKMPADEAGVEAMRLVLARNNLAVVKSALASNDAIAAAKLVEALGNTKDKKAVALMTPICSDAQRDILLRKMTVKALAQTQEGAEALLALARNDDLPADLRLAAGTELNAVRWPKVKAEAATLLPLPQGQNAQPLPPVAELVKLNGNPAIGEKVFNREQVACGSCHRVKGTGAEIGPDLSEIGSKLGRDALFEAILDPSAGISLGYEAFNLELKSGDEAYGLLVSETQDEIAIKDLKGIVSRFKKGDVSRKQQLKTSIMPTGLAAHMSTQELADLVAYLAELKNAQ